jgi:hypothetical protein
MRSQASPDERRRPPDLDIAARGQLVESTMAPNPRKELFQRRFIDLTSPVRVEERMRRSAALDFVEKVALLGALGLIVSPAVRGIRSRWRKKCPSALKERAVDDSIQDTFPASDPPAGRYFDIPVNRR